MQPDWKAWLQLAHYSETHATRVEWAFVDWAVSGSTSVRTGQTRLPSFVSEIPHNAEDVAIASAFIALAHSLNLRVVAEGVENEAQAAFLRRQGCNEMLGYLLSAPLASDDFVAWWRARHADAQAKHHAPPLLDAA